MLTISNVLISRRVSFERRMDANLKNFTIRRLTVCAIVASAYAVLTIILAPISYGAVQFRVSEVLCILPFFLPYTIWGLFVGCLLANLLGGNGILDIIFGSLATLAAGYMTSKIKIKWLAPLPPVIINGLVIGAVLAYLYTPDAFTAGFALMGAEVALGELGVLYLIGLPLIYLLPRSKVFCRLIDENR